MQGRVGLTYDTGGLIAAARGDPKLWRLHRQALAWQIQVDAAVVEALRRAEVVVTSDPQDLRQIADALGAPLTVHVL
jgi:hypothetical protein